MNSIYHKFNTYVDLVKESPGAYKWFNEMYGGFDAFIYLSNAIILSSDVQERGDQRCENLFPVMWVTDAPERFIPNGSKAKPEKDGFALPTALARMKDNSIVVATHLGGGHIVTVYSQSEVNWVTSIKIGSFMNYVPALQFGLADDQDGDISTFVTGDLFPTWLTEVIHEFFTDTYPSAPR